MKFREIWSCDFEYQRPDDNRDPPAVVCMVAREFHSRQEIRIFREGLGRLRAPPFPIDKSSCLVAYAAAAEGSCFAALGWPMPANVVDLYAERLLHINGKRRRPHDSSLLATLEHYGLPARSGEHKDAMRTKIIAQSDWSADERRDILDYCAEDVEDNERLLLAMDRGGHIDWTRALWRGAYMFATAYVEHNGIPIDAELYGRMQEQREALRHRLIEQVDREYGVYVGDSFNRKQFARWLTANRIPWPRLASGALALDQDTFKSQVGAYPVLAPLRQLTLTLAQMRTTGLTVGSDSRNRFWMRPLLSKTGRNQPSSSANILGCPSWMRGLITPPAGTALALIDWSAQEIAIAAGRSRDPAMCAAYETGDVHMAAAIAAGLAPTGATKETHPAARERIKCVSLGTNYGISPRGISAALGVSRSEGQALLDAHRASFPTFWRWLVRTVDDAMLTNTMTAPMGWRMSIAGEPNPRALQNWMMQATGAEMMRCAVVKLVRAGFQVCATAHDALLILVPAEQAQADIRTARSIMERVSLSFTRGLRVRTDAKVLMPGDRLIEGRGRPIWDMVCQSLR